jgi:hypothetical protein
MKSSKCGKSKIKGNRPQKLIENIKKKAALSKSSTQHEYEIKIRKKNLQNKQF